MHQKWTRFCAGSNLPATVDPKIDAGAPREQSAGRPKVGELRQDVAETN